MQQYKQIYEKWQAVQHLYQSSKAWVYIYHPSENESYRLTWSTHRNFFICYVIESIFSLFNILRKQRKPYHLNGWAYKYKRLKAFLPKSTTLPLKR